MLLNNGNRFGSVPIRHSTKMNEKYLAIKIVLEKLDYNACQRFIPIDLEMDNFILGQQSSYTKYLCSCACGITGVGTRTEIKNSGQNGPDFNVYCKYTK